MTKQIEIKKAGSDFNKRLPFHAYVNGVLLRKKDGTGRRFKTEVAARKAAEAA